MDTAAAWDTLIELGVSEQTLQIVSNINGYSLATLENVLYAHAGIRSFDQLENDDEVDATYWVIRPAQYDGNGEALASFLDDSEAESWMAETYPHRDPVTYYTPTHDEGYIETNKARR